MGADPLTLGIVAGGAAVQWYGQKEANKAEARAQRANALEFQAQKKLSEMAARREADIFLDESAAFIGEQVSSLAKSGVQMGASELMVIADSESKASREYAAIQAGAAGRASIFDMQTQQANTAAARLRSSSYNNVQTLGTVLNAGGNYLMLAKNKGSGDDV